jgi:hypothetical protein
MPFARGHWRNPSCVQVFLRWRGRTLALRQDCDCDLDLTDGAADASLGNEAFLICRVLSTWSWSFLPSPMV